MASDRVRCHAQCPAVVSFEHSHRSLRVLVESRRAQCGRTVTLCGLGTLPAPVGGWLPPPAATVAPCLSSPPPSVRIPRCSSRRSRPGRRRSWPTCARPARRRSADLLAAGPDLVLAIGASTPSGASVGRPDRPLELWPIGAMAARPAPNLRWRWTSSDVAGRPRSGRLRPRSGGTWPRGQSRIALLVMGDGSACRGPQSPGYDDPRAEAVRRGRRRGAGRRGHRGPAGTRPDPGDRTALRRPRTLADPRRRPLPAWPGRPSDTTPLPTGWPTSSAFLVGRV